MIRTLHRFGYAFAGQLEREVGVDSSEPVLGWLIAEPGGSAAIGGRFSAAKGTAWCRCPLQACRDNTQRSSSKARPRGCATSGSKNGTFVDEMRVEGPTALRDGAQLRFGTLHVTYRSAQQARRPETI